MINYYQDGLCLLVLHSPPLLQVFDGKIRFGHQPASRGTNAQTVIMRYLEQNGPNFFLVENRAVITRDP